MTNKFLTFAFLIALAVFVSACTGNSTQEVTDSPDTRSDDQVSAAAGEGTTVSDASSLPLWMTAELKDVATGNIFTINDFKGKQVLLESFAVWCPICTRQQQESKKLESLLDVVSISIDTDPNEDEARIQNHIQRQGFDWLYTISPVAVTNSLIDDFGLTIVNVPLAPMIVICGDQTTHRLRNGVKSAEELRDSIVQLCGA